MATAIMKGIINSNWCESKNIIVSDKNEDILTGYTEHNKVVNFPGDKSLIGTIVNVEIEKAFSWHLRGKLV